MAKHNKSKSEPVKTPVVKPIISPKTIIPFIIAVILFLLVWKDPEVVAMDPWNRAAKLLDSSNRAKSPQEKSALLEEAGTKLVDLVEKYPKHARVQFLTGYYYFMKQNWDMAMNHNYQAYTLDSGATINPVWIDARKFFGFSTLNKANALLANNKIDSAVTILKFAASRDPRNPQLNKTLGNILINSSSPQDAINYYSAYLSTNPNDADVYNNLGVIMVNTNQIDKAKQLFAKALQINPKHPKAKVNLEKFK